MSNIAFNFKCSRCGRDGAMDYGPAGKALLLCSSCKAKEPKIEPSKNFDTLVDTVERQHAEKEHVMQKASELILAENVSRGQGIIAAAQRLQELRPFFVDEHRLLWMWNEESRSWRLSEDTPGRPVELVTIMRQALRLIGDASVRYESLLGKAIQQIGLSKRPEMLGKEWIQLGNELHNIKTGEKRISSPRFFVPCAIPWTPGESEETPTITKLFIEWVGVEHAETLFEIVAYALYRDYPIHVIVALFGSGRNGKGRYFALLRKFLGPENVASTELDRLLENRFETFHLYGKLVALCGETDDTIISKTSLLKSLSGQDPIPFEKKGGAQFTEVNTAKIILSTNNLPPSTDASDGWARRWVIKDFPNQFPEGHDILATIPDYEYNNLSRRCLRTLSELLVSGEFTEQGSIEERRKRYIERSEPLRQYVEEEYSPGEADDFVKYSEFSTGYASWLSIRHKRSPGRGQISKQLAIMGYAVERANPRYPEGEQYRGTNLYIFGLRRKVTGLTGHSGLYSQLEKSHIERNENYVPNVPNIPERPENEEMTSIDKLGVCSACCLPDRWLHKVDAQGREYCRRCRP